MLKIMAKTMLSLSSTGIRYICSVQVYPGISSTGIRYDKLDLTPEHCMEAPIEDWMFVCSIALVILKV